jgi:uncharacterized protein
MDRELPDRICTFEDGIQFECQKCGGCCTGAPGEVRLTMEEAKAMSTFLRMPEGNFLPQFCRYSDQLLLKEKANGDCVFFQGGSCMVYPVRPRQCRTFPFWLKALRSAGAWTETERQCPGVGKGRRYSKKEILDLLQESDI